MHQYALKQPKWPTSGQRLRSSHPLHTMGYHCALVSKPCTAPPYTRTSPPSRAGSITATRYGVQRGGARVATNNPAFVPFTTWLTNTSSGQLVNQQQAQLSNGTNSTNGTAGSADPWVISLEDFVAQRTAGQALTVDLYVVDSEDAAHLDPGVQTALLQFMASGGGAWVHVRGDRLRMQLR